MEKLKLLLSYIIPFTKKYDSKLNHTLEINYINGKKLLDSPNANYSYGKLQKIMNFGLNKIELKEFPEVLLLGLGGGCVIESIEKKYHHCKEIIAVEIDPVVIRLAREEFQLDRFKELKIVLEDASDYVHNNIRKFDLIIVDLFIDDKVPEPFYNIDFWEHISKELNPDGDVIFNAGMNMGKSDKIDKIISALASQIGFVQYENVQQLNTVLIGHKINSVA